MSNWLYFSYRLVKREREADLWVWYRVSCEMAGGLFQVQVVKRDWKEKLVLCKRTSKTASHVFECVSPFPISPLSLTCKWQKDSVMTFDTCPLCFSKCLDNCYGNCMSQRSVDWLIQAVSQTDESFEPTCLFRSALVVMLWQPVWWLSPVIIEHIRCEETLVPSQRWRYDDDERFVGQNANVSAQWSRQQKVGEINRLLYISFERCGICRQVNSNKERFKVSEIKRYQWCYRK